MYTNRSGATDLTDIFYGSQLKTWKYHENLMSIFMLRTQHENSVNSVC